MYILIQYYVIYYITNINIILLTFSFLKKYLYKLPEKLSKLIFF